MGQGVVAPQDVVRAGLWALAFFAAMQLVRWLMVQVLLLQGSFDGRQKQFICWTGLRGAVPIAMAIQACAARAAFRLSTSALMASALAASVAASPLPSSAAALAAELADASARSFLCSSPFIS